MSDRSDRPEEGVEGVSASMLEIDRVSDESEVFGSADISCFGRNPSAISKCSASFQHRKERLDFL